jgi:DNA polymerase-1
MTTYQFEPLPDTAILDGDILAYRIAFWAESEGIEDIEIRAKHDVSSWTPKGINNVYIALSCPRSDNFRRKIWDPYKRHRDVNRKVPESLPLAIDIICNLASTRVKPNIEADDLLGIWASKYRAIAVTVDKDLRSVRGWHWNPDKEEAPVLVDARQAEYNFHKQWLTGDTTDNIPGIWKCGPVKAQKILDSVQPKYWTDAVMYSYQRFKDSVGNPYSLDFCLKMAQCVRILRAGEYNFETNQPNLWTPDFSYSGIN